MGQVVIDDQDVDPTSAAGKELNKTNSPADKPVDKPVDKPAETPPADKPIDKPVDKPVDKPASDKPADSPADSVLDKDKYATELLEEIFGTKGVDKETAKKIALAARDLPTLSAKLADLEKNQTVFVNDYVKGLNDYLSKGGTRETYDRVQALDLDKLSGLELIKAQYKWDHPELTDEQITLKLNKKYQQTEDFDEPEKQLGLVDIAIDSKEAKKKLEAIKQKESVPDAERQRLINEEAEQKRVADWKPQVKNLVDATNGLDIVLETDDKGNPTKTFQFKISDQKLKDGLMEDANGILDAWDVQPTPENIKALNDVLRDRVIVREHANIVKAIWNEAKTTIDKQYRDKYHIGDEPPAGDKPPVPGAKSNEDDLYEKQLKRERGY